jgi:hypothetical protein
MQRCAPAARQVDAAPTVGSCSMTRPFGVVPRESDDLGGLKDNDLAASGSGGGARGTIAAGIFSDESHASPNGVEDLAQLRPRALGERNSLRAGDDLFDDPSCSDDYRAFCELFLGDAARLGARAA